MTPNLTGRLLIASPHLTDGNFLRSVVFIIRHDVEGAFGLTVNRATGRRFSDLIDCPPAEGAPREDDHIYRGGPVEGPLLALHELAGVGDPCGTLDQSNPSSPLNSPSASDLSGESTFTVHDQPAEAWGSMSIELGNPPAWITGDDDHLRILLRRPDARVRYVAHYSGWGAGQLEEELQAGGWLNGDADPEVLFGDPDQAWETAVKSCGHEILSSLAPGVSIDHVASGDPGMN